MVMHKVGGGQCFPYFVVFSECFSMRPRKRAQRKAKHVDMGSMAKHSLHRGVVSLYMVLARSFSIPPVWEIVRTYHGECYSSLTPLPPPRIL